MGEQTITNLTIGWIGTGRMGYAMAERLLAVGADAVSYTHLRAHET